MELFFFQILLVFFAVCLKRRAKHFFISKTAKALARGQKPWKEGSKDLLTVGH